VDGVVLSMTLGAEMLSAVVVGVSIVYPGWRIWPPPHQGSRWGYLMWLLFGASAAGVVTLGIIDWRSLALPLWTRWAIGVPLWSSGNLISSWAMLVLGMASTFGGNDGLARRGPYRFSRNPQYLGFAMGLIGWAILTSSRLTLAAALVGLIPLALVSFTEEPWLEERYGAAYEEYRRAVPRFIGQRRRKI
jgi:protein-S-isoprenylcysteine O-methyltransferase Ste14